MRGLLASVLGIVLYHQSENGDKNKVANNPFKLFNKFEEMNSVYVPIFGTNIGTHVRTHNFMFVHILHIKFCVERSNAVGMEVSEGYSIVLTFSTSP